MGGQRDANRLAGESSPYLRLHAHNPVDWYPWGEEALVRARREDRPIFLSVGYSTCYWCHVMERESFSDPAIAGLMNASFVNIKVDREERPELDEIYMTATQLLTGQGGWPNSLFLTPELEPFFAGTYFPPDDRYGRPGFATVLRSLAEAWKSRRAEVEEQGREVAKAVRVLLGERGAPGEPPGRPAAEVALTGLERAFDRRHGGFGGAPKFPTPANLFLLLELAGAAPRAADMLDLTLDRMARGGLFDQLAGGFHRYAVDAEWRVPHFEKMLYDNGLLLEVYARRLAMTGAQATARVARRTAEFLLAELRSPEGAFWSAIDAETDGHEGAYYVWTREQLLAALGDEEFGFLAPLYGFDRAPFFEGDAYVLHQPAPLADQAVRRRTTVDELLAEIEPLTARLLEARARRPRPATDDKILADWNGAAIAGLAAAGAALGAPKLLSAAARAAEWTLQAMRAESGTLLHAWRAGSGSVEAFLADYALLGHGLLALHEADGEDRWLQAAAALADEQEERLAAPEGGWFTAAERPDVLARSREVFDGAIPSGNALAALDLIELARRTGEERFRVRAATAVGAFAGLLGERTGAATMLAVAAARLAELDAPSSAHRPPPTGVAEEARRVVDPQLELGPAAADGSRALRLLLQIAPGWHLNAHRPGVEGLEGTRLETASGELRIDYPEGEPLEAAAAPRVYRHRVVLEGTLQGAAEGSGLRLLFQPCDARRCLPLTTLDLSAGP